MKRCFLPFAILLAACGNDATPPGPPPPGEEPVYYGQVQRIINDNCVECHSADPDRLAPFALVTYDDVKAAAEDAPMAFAIMNREMPPFYAKQDGTCNSFSNATWLDDDELSTLTVWINGSKLEGDPANTVAAPPPLPGLPNKNYTIDTGAAYTPDTAVTDDFRCFVVDAIGANKFVTGVHVHPSNLTVAHHVVLFTLASQAAEDDVLAQQAAAGGGPYKCDGGPTQLGASFLAGWVPGNQATLFPANTGIPVDGSRKLVVQMHYNLAQSDGKPDHTTIDIQLADSVAKTATMVQINGNVDLKAHDPDATATGSVTIPSGVGTVKLWGSVVHMHQRGTSAQVEVPNQQNQCLLDLVNWSFHWQHFYWYDQPVELHGGDTVSLTCHYDMTNEASDVGFCETTSCEMCIEFVYVTTE